MHITHHRATLTGNIYISNNLVMTYKSAILTTHISDHFPCLGLINININANKVRILNNMIDNTDWSEQMTVTKDTTKYYKMLWISPRHRKP